MNIFEDLVEELKEENLLEETVIEINQEKEARINSPETNSFNAQETISSESNEDLRDVLCEFKDVLDKESSDSALDITDSEQPAAEPEMPSADLVEEDEIYPENAPIPPAPDNEAEFYIKRATDEVTGLQLVEHVFSGVEREQMKVLPKPYDDLECKKALHAFMQVSADQNSPEHAQAEFHLMQETESWYSALSRRDRNISVTHLRRYCETTRPALSPTALASIARFYRNAPFSEQVRSKYDLILTRLFTKDIENDKRILSLKREEFINHLNTLYSQWASVPLYTANEDDSEILLIALKFDEFITEAESAENFDQLIRTDFFNRLRQLKESTNENFFAPLVTASAIECNVRVGNCYVDLIQKEKEKSDKRLLEDKYGFQHDQAISESSSKTLQLIQLLQEKVKKVEPAGETENNQNAAAEMPEKEKKQRNVTKQFEKKNAYKVNKWLLAATIVIVLINVGLYFWMTFREEPEISQKSVIKVNLENSSFRDYLKEARISGSTLFAVVSPNWSSLSKEKQENLLQKIYSTGGEKGFSKAHLLDRNGRSVGYIDAKGVQLY